MNLIEPIKERIKTAYEQAGQSGGVSYHALMRAVFPPDQYPKAWRYSSNGGPPGCAMAFGRALREMKAHISKDRKVWIKNSVDSE